MIFDLKSVFLANGGSGSRSSGGSSGLRDGDGDGNGSGKSGGRHSGESSEIRYELDISSIDIDGFFPFTSPVVITAVAVNRASLVTLTLDCEYGFCRLCDRCGKELRGTEHKRFTHRLVQTLVDETNDDYIETPDFTLELDEVVISDILLHYPQKVLCREDCKGLCPVCGTNRNEGDCSCNRQPVDPRMEILKQLIKE